MGDRLKQLDGLRAIAVLLVFAFHVFPQWVPGGYVGVDLFFVLSGYLITKILLAEFEASGGISLRNFYWRRFLRLTPALFFMLACYVALMPVISGDIRQHWIAALSSLYAMNWVRAFDLAPTKLLGHTWSLAIEEQFYLLWPVALLAMLSKRIDPTKVICALILAVVSWRMLLWGTGATEVRLYCGFDTRADVLLFGCLIAAEPRAAKMLARFAPLAIALILFVTLRIAFDSNFMLTIGYTITALASASIVAALASDEQNLGQRLLSFPAPVYLGTISYGFYLWHFVFVSPLEVRHVNPLLIALIALPCSIAVAIVSRKFVEQPFLKFRRRQLVPQT